MADPERIILTLRVLPMYLENGNPWPWPIRCRRLLRNLLRSWGLELVKIEEIEEVTGAERSK